MACSLKSALAMLKGQCQLIDVKTGVDKAQRTCQCVTLPAHCWISGCETSELQTSETIAHRVVTSRLTAAGSGGGAGSMLAAGTSVKIDGAEDVLIPARCRCSDCTCMCTT